MLSELGRYPLYFNIVKSMLNYYLRLEKTGSTFPLLNDAYIESKLLHNAKKSSWYSSIKFVLDKVSSLLNVDSSKINGERLKDFFVKDWQKRLKESSSGKLCSYYLFKNNFGCENYLSLIKKFSIQKEPDKISYISSQIIYRNW